MRIHASISLHRSQVGFTLVEVSVAMLLLTMVLTFVYESFILTLETKERVEKRAERFQSARVAMQRMERELQSSYIENNVKTNATPQPPQPPQPNLPTPAATSAPRTVFLGVNTDSDGYPADRLDFTTFAHYVIAAGGEDDRQSDHEEVAYFTERDFKENRTDLLHREDFTMDDDPLGGGDIFPLIESMRGINFRYLDSESKDWTDSWDSREKKSLPAAVEITLWLENPSNEKQPLLFVKVVRVPLYSVSSMKPLQVTSASGPLGADGLVKAVKKAYDPTIIKDHTDEPVKLGRPDGL